MARVLKFGGTIGLCLGLASCVLPEDAEVTNESNVGMVMRKGQAHSNSFRAQGSDGGKLVLDFQHSDRRGRSMSCASMGLEVQVEYAQGGLNGVFRPISGAKVRVSCEPDSPFNLGIVVDNSGSQAEAVDEIRRGASSLAKAVIDAGGKVSLTRVSTQASTLVPLTSDRDAIDRALANTRVNRGWTALYDGIRVAYEGLGLETLQESKKSVFACRRARRTAVAVFTDGADNNSADEKNAKNSDGLATTIEDLAEVRHLGVKVPVFAIGMGDKVDHAVLEKLASTSGGRHLRIDDHFAVTSAFDRISDALRNSVEVCADLPVTCGKVGFRIVYRYRRNGQLVTEKESFVSEVDCPAPAPSGKVANVFMALSDPSLSPDFASNLIKNTANWVAAGRSKKVLVVLDDNHHFEAPNEVSLLESTLREAGYTVESITEPRYGLTSDQVKGFDTIWFTNPGYPIDDWHTLKLLRRHVGMGKGLIMSGDDLSRANAFGFDPARLTRVRYAGNGHRSCGLPTDNGSSPGYRLQEGNFSHPITQGLDFTSVEYRNDIDHSRALQPSTEVLAWGEVSDGVNCRVKVPVVTAHDFKSGH